MPTKSINSWELIKTMGSLGFEQALRMPTGGEHNFERGKDSISIWQTVEGVRAAVNISGKEPEHIEPKADINEVIEEIKKRVEGNIQ